MDLGRRLWLIPRRLCSKGCGVLGSGSCGGRIEVAGNDRIAVAGTGGKHSVVADLVRTGGWDQGYQPLDQLERFEHDVGRTVAPAVPEPVGEIPVGESGEALGGDGRPGHVATESLEARAVPRRDADARVQANARHARTERSGNAPERFGVDPLAKPPDTPAGSFSGGHAALHRCSGELSGLGQVVGLWGRVKSVSKQLILEIGCR